MEEKLLKIINHYGVIPQLKYFQSEVFELNESILEYENFIYYSPNEASSIMVNGDYFTIPKYAKHLRQHIAEEIADVMVMLCQFKEYYGIDGNEIMKIMNEKIDRQLKRIEEDEKNRRNKEN